jgi:hypothetical protein
MHVSGFWPRLFPTFAIEGAALDKLWEEACKTPSAGEKL